MFLRSFLQRKSKKDSEGSHSTSKGDKNAGKKNDPKLEVVKMTKMKSLPDNQEDSEVSGLKNHEARETSNASYDQTSHNERKARSSIESHPEEETAHLIPIPSSSPSSSSPSSSSSSTSSSSSQQQTPQFQTSLSISRDESESSQELLKVLVGQQGDGTFGESVDQYPSQSLHIEENTQESMNESTLDDGEVSGSDSQVEELIKEVLKTVSRELQTEQLTADLDKRKLSTTAVTTIQYEESKSVGKSEDTNGQSEIFHALTNGIIVNNPKREHEENRVGLFGEVASFETNRRQSGIAGRDVVSEGNFTLRTGQYEESKSITDTEVTKKEPDVVGGGSDISLSEPNVVINQESLIEDDWNPTSARDVTGQVTSSSSSLKGTLLFPAENDKVIHRRQLLETSSRKTNTATSVLTTVKDSPTLSENLAAEVFLQTITSNICAKRDEKDIMPDADMIKTSSTVGSLKDDIVDNEIKANSEENESMYYTIENLESSLDTSDDAKDTCSSNDRSNKVEEDVIVKSRLNVLACKFEMGKPYKCGTISNGPSAKAEEDDFKDILSIPYANSTPEKYTWSAYKDRVPRQTYSEEYFSPKSGFINGVSFCEMDCMTNNCSDWSQMHEVEDFNVYHKGTENSSDIYDVNLPHNTCEDFVITPCQDSDTDDGEDDGTFEETTAKDHIEERVPILGGNEDDSVGSSLEEIYNADNDDANTKTDQVRDRFQEQQQQPAESVASSAEEVATFTQSKEEKMIDLKNFEEFRKNNMLRAITNILVKVEGRLGNTVGTLKKSLEEFIKKTAILADEGQRTAPTEWEATEDEGELGLLDTRLRSSIDQQASLALSLKNTEERTRLMETQLEQWEVGEEDRKRQIISLREEVEGATARQRSLTVMLNDERRMKEALQLRVSTMTQEKQQLLFNNVMLWEQTSQLELKQEHFQSVSEQERMDLEEHTKALESELLALRSLKAGEPVKKISSESTCSISSDHTPTGSCTPKQDGDVETVDGHEARESSSRYMVPYDHPPQAPDDFPEGEFYGPVPYPHYRGSHRPNHNNSGYPFPQPRFPSPFARGSYPRRRGEHHRVHYNGMQPLPWYPNDRDSFHRERERGQRPVRGRIFRGRGRGRGYGRGRRGRFHREGQS